MKLVVALAPLVIVACGSSSSSGTSDDAGGGGDDASAAMDATGDTTQHPGDGAASGDASSSDASAAPDASDGGGSGAHPPPGAARCGHGTFTQADAQTACAMPNGYLDNGPGMKPRYCDGATITGGSWEVWCSSSPTYVWVRYEGLKATGQRTGCMGNAAISLSSGWAALGGSGSGMMPRSGTPMMFDQMASIDAELATLGNTPISAVGTGTLFLIGTFPGACGNIGPQAVMSGVAISWDVARDGG